MKRKSGWLLLIFGILLLPGFFISSTHAKRSTDSEANADAKSESLRATQRLATAKASDDDLHLRLAGITETSYALKDPFHGFDAGATADAKESLTLDPACLITCPANITVSNDPNQCGAVVIYPAPTANADCGTVVCSPASGSFYPVGTTTITCTTTAGPTCSFTVTVNDTQPPNITCPANITATSSGLSTVVTYPAPTASDNCPGVTTVCNPPSGSNFPVGVTTTTCTATDASANTATCSFSVNVLGPNAFGVDTANNLVRFNVLTPGTIVSSVPITGLQAGETVLAIDFRPVNDTLYALGSSSRVYVLDQATGVAGPIGAGAFTPVLSGTEFGFDFNPVVDRIRVTSNTGQNLRLSADTGTVIATDTNLAYASGDPHDGTPPQVVGSAYTNSVPGATTTTLYAIDSNLDILAIQNPPNNGTLNTVGSLGVNASAVLGFDISSPNTAFATLVVGGTPGLYLINLSTGAASFFGAIGGGTTLRGLAIVPPGFTASLSGTAATFTGSDASDSIVFDQSGGLLRHNRFSAGDIGFNSDFDFDPTVAGDQTLSASNPAVSVIVNGGLRDDRITIGSSSAPAAGLAASIFISGQGGNDQLIINDSADASARNIAININTVQGISGLVTYSTLEGVQVNAGSGGDTITIQGTQAALTSVNAGGGNDTISLLNGASLSGGLIDGGAGANTLDYTGYNLAFSVDLTPNKQLFLAQISGTQEPGPLSSSQASGSGSFLLNADQTQLSFNISYKNIEGATITGTHFHNEAFGVNGPIVRGLTPSEQNGLTVPNGTLSGVWTSSDPVGIGGIPTSGPLTAALVNELLANRIYFNIHSTLFPSGEIRGQLFGQGFVGTATGTGGVRNIAVGGPSLTINDVAITEGNSGSTNAVFTVSLAPASSQTVTVDYTTANGTAMEPSDYTAVNGTVTFSPGQTSRTIFVPVNGDTIPEADETFFVNLTNATNAFISDGQGVGTIINDDPGGTLQFSQPAYAIAENASSATITVTRTGSTLGTVTVNFATSNGTATAGSDYGNTAGTLTFGPGVTSQTFSVPILDDTLTEGTETVNLTLSGPTGGGTLGPQSTATLSILDNESVSPDVFGVTTTNNLVRFNSIMPEVIVSTVAITGLQPSENVLDIDFRPATGQLYALGSTSRLYTINTTTGAATQVGSAGSFTLNGTDFGMDFNPVVDRIRVVSDADQNIRLNPNDGTLAATDTPLAYAFGDVNFGANPNVTGAAYTNNFVGAATTTLYGIDSNLDILVRQGGLDGVPSPNGGQLSTIGILAVNTTGLTGFDIRSANNAGYASLSSPGDTSSKLYTVNLATGAATFLGTIGGPTLIRDIALAPAGSFQFSASTASVSEDAGKVTVTINRSGNTTGTAMVNVNTADGTATQRGDYTIRRAIVTFAPGETSKTVDVFITDDAFIEGSETFTIGLSNPTGDFSLNGTSTLTVTITDNDSNPAAPNPIDSTPFFVRQHYIDFLNREPDPPGFAAWVSILNNCAAGDTSCDRVHVSEAFFKSPEFQQRGYFAYRFYPVAFGRKPDYLEFMPDIQRLSGFLDTTQLEAAKVALIADFMARPAFVAIYNPLNNTQYVDTLLATAMVTLPAATRQALIDGLNTTTLTRAQVLRQIVESNEVSTKYFNQAFVVMEYFGYLRRDPDILYLTWIAFLDSGASSRTMVSGFVNSPEYRQRFAP